MSATRNDRLHLVSAHFNLQPYHAARYTAFVANNGGNYRLTSLLLRPTSEYSMVDQRCTPLEGFSVDRVAICSGETSLTRSIDDRLLTLQPDIILLLGGYSDPAMLAVISWAICHRVPLILCSESKADDHSRRGIQEALKSRICRLFGAALVGGKSHVAYAKQLGFREECIFTGYDAIDNSYFAGESAKIRQKAKSHRARLDLPENYFLASARFIEKKNFLRLLEAYSKYYRRMKVVGREPWDLVLLGGGPMETELKRMRSEQKLTESVHMPGFKQYPELPVYYALAECFIHPSTREEWGLVVNEAMASGLPVLVSDRCGCVPDLVINGENGFTFDPYDIDALADLLGKLGEIPIESRARMARLGQLKIADWGPERFANGLNAACATVLKNAPKRAVPLERLILRVLMMR